MSFTEFYELIEVYFTNFAKIVILLLESLGIIVIVCGSVKSVCSFLIAFFKHRQYNIKISLGNSLTLGLEFKMGSEIINTVLVRDLQELWILAIIIILRALLAVLIHWEIKTEKKMSKEENNEMSNFRFTNSHVTNNATVENAVPDSTDTPINS